MAHVIAVAGKGGVGKTTLCGMLIQYLCEKGKGRKELDVWKSEETADRQFGR